MGTASKIISKPLKSVLKFVKSVFKDKTECDHLRMTFGIKQAMWWSRPFEHMQGAVYQEVPKEDDQSLQIALKIKLPKNVCLIFFFFFYTKNFLLDLPNVEKVWIWDGCGFRRYARFSSFWGYLGTTGVTKINCSFLCETY